MGKRRLSGKGDVVRDKGTWASGWRQGGERDQEMEMNVIKAEVELEKVRVFPSGGRLEPAD